MFPVFLDDFQFTGRMLAFASSSQQGPACVLPHVEHLAAFPLPLLFLLRAFHNRTSKYVGGLRN